MELSDPFPSGLPKDPAAANAGSPLLTHPCLPIGARGCVEYGETRDMTIHTTSIAAGKCFVTSGEAGVRRVVKLEHSEVTYQDRSRQAVPGVWGSNVTSSVGDFAAEVEREVKCDFDRAD
jgi:hypothetical protein